MRVRLIEGWKHQIKGELAKGFRKAINDGDREKVKETSIKLLDHVAGLVEDDSYASSTVEDLRAEFSVLDAENDDEDFDSLLSDLYDTLDENDIWVDTL